MADDEERKSASPMEDMMELDDDSAEDGEEEEEEDEDEEEMEVTASSSPSASVSQAPIVLSLGNRTSGPKGGSGKPLSIRRGRGRPRKGDPGYSTPPKRPLGLKLKRYKGGQYSHEIGKSLSKSPKDSPLREDILQLNKSPSPSQDASMELSLTGPVGVPLPPSNINSTEAGIGANCSEKPSMPAPDEPPYFPERWPGKVCTLCNLPEKSQLGQGEMLRLVCPEGFDPRKCTPSTPTRDGMMSPSQESVSSIGENEKERESPVIAPAGDKSPRMLIPQSRRKNMTKRNSLQASANEMLDELGMVGYADEVDLGTLFDAGNYYVHYGCAVWSAGVSRSSEGALEGVASAVVESVSRRCSYGNCGRLGASVACQFAGCPKHFHLPCAAALGGFQCSKTHTLICSLHLDQVPLLGVGDVSCKKCNLLGEVSNLTMCSKCGGHYHGACVGMAFLPEVRAGWLCSDCRYCQVCRLKEMDHTKIMVCEKCDKAYHPTCQRPIVTSIPKFGWKCKFCRVCTDCGSRTPGAGHSSRWHAHYTVCDSCYQQRNKGYFCPLCRRAYRAAAVKDMVTCNICRKAVHSSCDTEADVLTYTQRKRTEAGYDYVCPICKQYTSKLKRKNSLEDGDSLSASQESLMSDDPYSDLDSFQPEKISLTDGEEGLRGIGLGKGKPFSAGKIAKKKLGISNNLLINLQSFSGRAIGISGRKGVLSVTYQKKNQKIAEFGRKRGPKSKMRGVFGVPGLGLQRPLVDAANSKKDDDHEDENRLVLVSAKDKFVLTQDICVMCGALGQDQEGCLIACAQCGQCYHPYCVSVKITKVILQKGWRCLDCTVCEGCGQRHDESRLILCDDCDISYHIYCMDPPLDFVPDGNWKCKWCVQCTTCGASDPGTNCHWLNGFTECGPCGSRTVCPICQCCYSEGALIIKCVRCERWLHCSCDSIRTEADAEKCAEEGYNCPLCRPPHVPPPHLFPPPSLLKPKPLPALPAPARVPSPPRSPDLIFRKSQEYLRDGVVLSESGLMLIKSLEIEKEKRQMSDPKKKRFNRKMLAQMGPVVLPSRSDSDAMLDGETNGKETGDGDDDQDEPLGTFYRDGMVVAPKEDGSPPEPPEGFTIHTSKCGNLVLRRIRVRNLKNIGIGGFNARLRNNRYREENDDPLETSVSNVLRHDDGSMPVPGDDKPKRKPLRRKIKSKLVENYPIYLQEAFFGKELLETSKDQASSSCESDLEESDQLRVTDDKTITLSQEELRAIEELKAKQEKEAIKEESLKEETNLSATAKSPIKEEDEGSDAEVLKDIFPKDFLDTDLVNTIMNEDDDMKSGENLDDIGTDSELADVAGQGAKDELTDILSPNFNLDCMVPGDTGLPNMDSRDVEEIFKGVLTDESQESQECNVFPINSVTGQILSNHTNVPASPSHHPVVPTQLSLARSQAVQSNISSPMSFPPPSPYQSEYSNSPQFSPAFSEPPHSPWVSSQSGDVDGGTMGGLVGDGSQTAPTQAKTMRNNTERMEADETLGNGATISAVLYANVNHPEWKKEYPSFAERSKQIVKKWRMLPPDQKAPYLQQARENRTNLKAKRGHQICVPAASTNKNPVTLMSSQPIATPSPSTPTQSGLKPVAVNSPSQPEVCSGDAGPDEEELLTASGVEQAPPTPTPPATPATPTPGPSPAPTPQLTNPPSVSSCAVANVSSSIVNIPTSTLVTSSAEVPLTMVSTITPSLSVPIPIVTAAVVTTSSAPTPSQAQAPKPAVPPPHHHHTIHHSPSADAAQAVPTVVRRAPSIENVNLKFLPIQTVSPQTGSTHTLHQYFPVQHIISSSSLARASNAVVVAAAPSVVDAGPRATIQTASIVGILTTNSVPVQVPLPAVDQQIRVLTPSEIMRTLPSLEPPTSLASEHDKIHQQKNSREAEQERQWKQLQALRQQQQQQQHHLQSQQAQALKVARHLSSDGTVNQFPLEQSSANPSTLPPQLQFNPGTGAPQRNPMYAARPAGDPYMQPPAPAPAAAAAPAPAPGTPRAQFAGAAPRPVPVALPSPAPGAGPGPDSYVAPPGTPRPGSGDPFLQPPTTPRPQGDVFAGPSPAGSQPSAPGTPTGQEGNQQLRDLLQRSQNQFKKLEPGADGQQRIWGSGVRTDQPASGEPDAASTTPAPSPMQITTSQQPPQPQMPSQTVGVFEQQTQQSQPSQPMTQGQNTEFRQPLPPSMARPRFPPNSVVVRSPTSVRVPLQPNDPRVLNSLDPRARLIIQQRAQAQGHIMSLGQQLAPQPGMVQFQAQHVPNIAPQATAPQQPQAQLAQPTVMSESQEIPDSVTAELEKLEQEGGPMAEVDNVGDILGGLEDDDELLAEMGADFNILEYADPELGDIGEKTNILDENLDLEEPDVKKDTSQRDKPDGVEAVESTSSDHQHQTSSTPANLPPQSQNLPLQSQVDGNDAGGTGAGSAPSVNTVSIVGGNNNNSLASGGIPAQQSSELVSRMVVDSSGEQRLIDNNAALAYQNSFQAQPPILQRLQMQVPQQRLQPLQRMNARVVVDRNGQIVEHTGVRQQSPRVTLAPPPPPPPPPPPYPGPPPPYPGSLQQHMTPMDGVMRMGPPGPPVHPGILPGPQLSPMLVQPQAQTPSVGPLVGLQGPPGTHMQCRTLLLQDQPLLLADLLEQEKQEQEKQQQQQQQQVGQVEGNAASVLSTPMISELELEPFHSSVLSSSCNTVTTAKPQMAGPVSVAALGSGQVGLQQSGQQQWVQVQRPPLVRPTSQPVPPPESRFPLFNVQRMTQPPMPPESVVSEADRQAHANYEQWLNHENQALSEQLKYYETEVHKLRKARKSLISKKRVALKNGNELPENDQAELQRITNEQGGLQKHLDAARKANRQHNALMQEYRNKQAKNQQMQQLVSGQPQGSPPVGQIGQQIGSQIASQISNQIGGQMGMMSSGPHQSPLRPPQSSPIHTPQSPMLCPSPSLQQQQQHSPLIQQQQHSPMVQQQQQLSPMVQQQPSPSPQAMQSPGPMLGAQSPGPNTMNAVVQHSPGNPSGMSPHSLQPSPRIGTPHSQVDDSPFSPGGGHPAPSPGQQVCPPPPSPIGHRLASPQHRPQVPTLPRQMAVYATNPQQYQSDQVVRMPGMTARFARTPGPPNQSAQGPQGVQRLQNTAQVSQSGQIMSQGQIVQQGQVIAHGQVVSQAQILQQQGQAVQQTSTAVQQQSQVIQQGQVIQSQGQLMQQGQIIQQVVQQGQVIQQTQQQSQAIQQGQVMQQSPVIQGQMLQQSQVIQQSGILQQNQVLQQGPVMVQGQILQQTQVIQQGQASIRPGTLLSSSTSPSQGVSGDHLTPEQIAQQQQQQQMRQPVLRQQVLQQQATQQAQQLPQPSPVVRQLVQGPNGPVYQIQPFGQLSVHQQQQVIRQQQIMRQQQLKSQQAQQIQSSQQGQVVQIQQGQPVRVMSSQQLSSSQQSQQQQLLQRQLMQRQQQALSDQGHLQDVSPQMQQQLIQRQQQQLQFSQQRQIILPQQQRQLLQQQQSQQGGQPILVQQQPQQQQRQIMQQQQTPPHPQTPSSPLQQPDRSPSVQAASPAMAQSPHQIPPNSPMSQQPGQFGPPQPPSPHVQSASPRPPQSPHITMSHPSSPMIQAGQSPMPPRSPMVSTQNPLGSPMSVRRPSSTGANSIANSPAVPDRPLSVENPLTPRTPQDVGDASLPPPPTPGGGGGGGNHTPIPLPPCLFGAFGTIKLGLRGGSPMYSMRQQQQNKPEAEKKQPVLIGCGSSGVNPRHASLVASDYNYSDDDLGSPGRSPDEPEGKKPVDGDELENKSKEDKVRVSESADILPRVTPKIDALSSIPKIDAEIPEILLEDDAAESPPVPSMNIDLAAEMAKAGPPGDYAEDEDSADMTEAIPETLTEEQVGVIIGVPKMAERDSVSESSSAVTPCKEVNSTNEAKNVPSITSDFSQEATDNLGKEESNAACPTTTAASKCSMPSSEVDSVSRDSFRPGTDVSSDVTVEPPVLSTGSPAPAKGTPPVKPAVAFSSVSETVGGTRLVQLPQGTPALVPVSVITNANAPRVLTPVSSPLVAASRAGAGRVAGPRVMTAMVNPSGGDVLKLAGAQISNSVVITSPRKMNPEDMQASPGKSLQDMQSPAKQNKSPVHLPKPVLILRPNPGSISQQTSIQVLQKAPVHFLQQGPPRKIVVQIPKSQQVGPKQVPVLVNQQPQPQQTQGQPQAEALRLSSPPTVQLSEQESINLLEKTTVQILQPTAASKRYEALLEAMERIHEGTDSSNLPESLELQSPIDSEIDQDVVLSGFSSQSATTSDSKRSQESSQLALSGLSETKVKPQPVEPVFEGLGKTLLQVSLSQSEQKSRVIVRSAGSGSVQSSTQSPSSFVSGSPKLASLLGAPTESLKSNVKRELLPDLVEAGKLEEKTKDDSRNSSCEREHLLSILQDPPSAPELTGPSATSLSHPPVSDASHTIESETSGDKKTSEKSGSISSRRSSQDITISSAADSDSTLTAMTLPPNIRQITSTIYSQSSGDRKSPNRPQSQPSLSVLSMQISQHPRQTVTQSASAPGSPIPDETGSLKSSATKSSSLVGEKQTDQDSQVVEQAMSFQGSPSKKSSRSQSTSALTSPDEIQSSTIKSGVSHNSKPENKPSLLQAQLMAGPIGPPPPYPTVIKEEEVEHSVASDIVMKPEDVKTEPMDVDEDVDARSGNEIVCPISNAFVQPKDEKDDNSPTKPSCQPVESQNVLLKQLLQNTACATSTPSITVKEISHVTSSLPDVPSLEAQLARPVPPTPSALIPPLLSSDTSQRPSAPVVHPTTPSKPSTPVSSAPLPSTATSVCVTTSGTSVTVTMPAVQQTITSVSPSVSGGNSTSVISSSAVQVAAPPLSTSSSPAIQTTPLSSATSVRTMQATNVGSQGVTPALPHVSPQTPTVPSSQPSTPGAGSPGVPTQTLIPCQTPIKQEVGVVQQRSPDLGSVSTQVFRQNLPQAEVIQGLPQRLPQQQGIHLQQSGAVVSGMQIPRSVPVQGGSTIQPGSQVQGIQMQPGVTLPSGVQMQPGAQGAQSGMHLQQSVQIHPNAQLQHGLQMQQRIQVQQTVQHGIPQAIPQGMHLQQVISQQGQLAHGVPTQVLNRMNHPGQPSAVMQPSHLSTSVIKGEVNSDCDMSSAPTPLDVAQSEKSAQEQAAIDLKKLKRRQYQQKRRQSQGKESATGKKRLRRLSKIDEDYDSWMESLMMQLRQLPPMTVLEPQLGRNYSVCCVYGSGDLTKVSMGCRIGDLRGGYGSATLSGVDDHYATQPYGDKPPLPPQLPISTQRGFYDQEFAPLQLDDADDKRLDFRDRDNDTPDTIISSSSPECVMPELPLRFPGLRLIDDDLSDEEEHWRKRASPIIPIIAPIPIRPRPGVVLYRDTPELDKENVGMTRDALQIKSRVGVPLKDAGNVSVTVTLSAAAAEDIAHVLRDLANILRIPAPTSYQVLERTGSSPSQKLGLYRYKSKDGREGAPVDIQSILNGAAKFCRHCDIVIQNSMIKKKISELAFLKGSDSLLGEAGGDDVYFCSSTCYMQFALMHRSPSISHDKAAAIVDHVCQAPSPPKKMRLSGDDEKSKGTEAHVESDDVEMTETDTTDPKLLKEGSLSVEKKDPSVPTKSWKGVRYRTVSANQIPPARQKYRKPSERELTEMLFRMVITVMPQKMPEDTRRCLFCHAVGDGVSDGPARLLNLDVDKWVHLNCALWSEDVYETVNGALMNIEQALQISMTLTCTHCHRTGATLRCFKTRCGAVYHLQCAVKDDCVFFKNKTLYCSEHVPKNDKENELTTLSVFRRVYINRDENRQVATVMHHSDENHLMRVGSLIFLNVGQLLPHQLQNFHNANFIYPIGYKIIRFYWSMRVANKRCRYICSIHEANGNPEFRVLVQEPSQEDLELRDNTAKGVWLRILEPMQLLRKENGNVNIFPKYISGEDLFGLTEPAVVRVLESLPGVETLTDYRFKYGRNPLLELPLAVNPTGCARSEPKIRGQVTFKRPHTQRTAGSSSRPPLVSTPTTTGEVACPYSKQFVHSKSSQYKKMKQEWRNNVYLARSKIAGLGLYATRDIERHTMVIEYIGEIIRSELSETREKKYQERNRGIYMFRLDEDRVVDATLSGGLARYINHSCNPNCVAETVEVDRDLRIIIFAKRRIQRGEELAYDYKFDIEDDQHKIPCLCGAPNCKKWMN